MKRRWLLIIVVMVAAASSIIAVRYVHQEKQATANLRAALYQYEQSFKPGMSRKEIKDDLRTKGIAFLEQCCNGVPNSPFSILAPVGERTSWFCVPMPDYVRIEFAAVGPHKAGEPSNSDVLREVHSTPGGCTLP